MTWEPTDEEVRAFAPILSERPLSKNGRKKWYRAVLRAAWAVSPGPQRTEALRTLLHLCETVGTFDNGVYAPNGMCEGDVWAGRYMDEARAALANGRKVR